MKKILKLALVSFTLLYPGLNGALHAQGYVVNAQITSQAVGDGTYNYTIQLNNDSSSTEPIETFWFAWVPNVYGYDLLASAPTITQLPAGWSDYVSSANYYLPPGADGYSIEFYNYNTPPAAGAGGLAPGGSLSFGFNSPDSPATLAKNSSYYPVPTLTSYVYTTYAESDPGAELLVTPTAVPEPSTTALLEVCAAGLLFVYSRQRLFLNGGNPKCAFLRQ
jgi:hypothetical protein